MTFQLLDSVTDRCIGGNNSRPQNALVEGRYRNGSRALICFVLSCLTLALSVDRVAGQHLGSVNGNSRRPNVLFIAIDDLRPELNCYGASQIHSPNIDRLAASGRVFKRAYCQQAVCNPSRTSVLTGLRPDTTGVTGNHAHFRDENPDAVTLPQFFKEHGYHSAAVGKIYHGVFSEGASNTKWDTMGDPQSWSQPAIRFGPRYYFTESGIAAAKRSFARVYKPVDPQPDDWTKKLVFGPATEAPEVSDDTLYDGKVADAAIQIMRQWADATTTRSENQQKIQPGEEEAVLQNSTPLFLAVGFIKPHSPYVAPRKYFDLYEDLELPSQVNLPIDAPEFSGHNSSELRRYTDQPKRGPIPPSTQSHIRKAYSACVSYIDAQVGKLLDELDKTGLSDNTIVVLWGDHGYHLGEHGLWGKTTNFELDTRVPLIIRAPKMNAPGQASRSIVELVDLYPTLAELAGLPISDQLEGKSLAPILNNPDATVKANALSQYPRRGLMGYSLRTATHRLTQWFEQSSGQVQATELYDYKTGFVEQQNIAGKRPAVVAQLGEQLRARLKSHLSAPAIELVDEASAGSALMADTQVTDGTQGSCGFEQEKPGVFSELNTNLGRWLVTSGRAIIDDRHAKTGRQCLQLTGGDETTVELALTQFQEGAAVLSFWAERWTARKPFAFRIEQQADGRWREIYNGDQKVRVGRAFLNYVEIPIEIADRERLRFVVTSPANTGVLIDDLRITPARPQQVVRVESIPFTLPALVGVQTSRLAKLRITTRGSLNPIRLTSLTGKLLRQREQDNLERGPLHTVAIASEQSMVPKGFAADASDWHVDSSRTFETSLLLKDGENTVWLQGRLQDAIEIDGTIGASIEQVTFSNGEVHRLSSRPAPQRLGVAVRRAGDEGIHTFRIPGLATTKQGTLIGVYDVRRRSGGDLPGDIDVGMSRSTDGGRTWEPMKVIMDMGQDPEWRYDGVGDPAVLVDQTTGTIWVAATWSHGNRSWHGSGPGVTPSETGQLMLVRSDDDGITWSQPINITEQVKKPEWCFILQGPGKGITMRDGTLVFAAQYQDPPGQSRLPHSTIIYSQDHGTTWQVGTGACEDTTEAQVVELEPGVLMLNCRYNRGPTRVVMTTRDLGRTWQEHTTSQRALIEPGACMASLIKVDRKVAGEDSCLLFSNPDSMRGRERITIKASLDRGMTWPKSHRLLLDEHRGAGYSCMSMIDDKTIGILYEGSQAQMTFQRIPLEEVIGDVRTGSKSTPASSPEPTLRLPKVFGNHMVLQAGAAIPVWGKSRPQASVSVTLGNETESTQADQFGDWSVRLRSRTPSSSPLEMRISSGNEQIHLSNILIGEVWVCAGQSNMAWKLRQSEHGMLELDQLPVRDGSKPKPAIRLLHMQGPSGTSGASRSYQNEQLSRLTPSTFFDGQWEGPSQESAGEFSAVAWYFGRYLRDRLDAPVGLICLAVGGTPTESWIPRDALKNHAKLGELVQGNWLDNQLLGEFCRTRGEQNLLAAIQAGEEIPRDELGPNHAFKPGFMWEAGIRPMIPFGIRGVIWYQGESNAENQARVRQHGELFPLMIKQWREQWGQSNLPFLFAQLPAMERPDWPWFREQQRRTLEGLDDLGMAVTVDTGDRTNVHPRLKRPIGERLARWALGTTYAGVRFPSVATSQLNSSVAGTQESGPTEPYSGPLFNAASLDGSTIAVTFAHVGTGLKSADQGPLRHFEVCGDNGIFHNAEAAIRTPNTVWVSSPDVPEPREVRYAWIPYPDPKVNLVNSANLPASPFSTEDVIQPRLVGGLRRPNVLFIVSEDNGDHLGCYGEQRVHTPHLDALASRGIRYANAYVPYSVCSPSRSAFLTGLYTRQTGHIGLATHRFSMYRDFKTIPAYLRDAGYYVGFLGKTHVNPERLVEDFVDHRSIENSNFSKSISIEKYAEEAEVVMNQAAASGKPFSLIINFADAHRQFIGKSRNGFPTKTVEERIPPFPWIGSDTAHLREELRDYFNCLNRLDEGIGMVLQKLKDTGNQDNTLVIYISDHGADFPRGKGSVYENGTRVPMIVSYPTQFSSGKVEHGLVSTVDILPTILRAVDLPVPEHLPGVALQDIDSQRRAPRDYIHTFTTGSSPNLLYMQFGIRDQRYKLIYNPDRSLNRLAESRYKNSQLPPSEQVQSFLFPPEYELFDLQEDPHEWQNLADSPTHKEIKSRLLQAMHDFQNEIHDPFVDPENVKAFISEQKAYQSKPYRTPGFQWPHLEMFGQAQDSR